MTPAYTRPSHEYTGDDAVTTDNTADVPAYIAYKPCGCVVMIATDEPQWAADNAKEVAKCIRAGYRVEHTTVGFCRTVEWDCPTHRKQPTAAQETLF